MLSNEEKNEALDCYRVAVENARITSYNSNQIELEVEFEASERGHENSREMGEYAAQEMATC